MAHYVVYLFSQLDLVLCGRIKSNYNTQSAHDRKLQATTKLDHWLLFWDMDRNLKGSSYQRESKDKNEMSLLDF